MLNKSQRFKPVFLKFAAQTFEAGDFLQVFLRVWGFSDWFSHRKTCTFSIRLFANKDLEHSFD